MRAKLIKQTRGRARRAHEVAMLDYVVVARPSDSSTLNPTTGVVTPDDPTEVYEGRCRFQPIGRAGNLTDREDTPLTVDDYQLVVPIDSGPYQIGDVFTFAVLSDSCVNPAGVWRVTAVPQSKWQTVRRLPAEQVTDRG